ncbi:hypothetical protein ABPG75_009987 [Micractinium tetrahymenae]
MWNVWTAYDMYGADINPIIGVTAQRSDARNTPLEIFPGSGPPSSSTLSPDGFNEATITYGKEVNAESLRATGLVVDLGARCSAPAVGKPQKSFTLFSGRGNDGFTVQSTDGFNKAATLSATTAM